jgi:hypothetical protein
MKHGLIWLWVFMLLTALRVVYLGQLLQGIHPALLLLGCFGLVTLLFLVQRIIVDRSLTRWLKRSWAVWPDLLALNLTTAVVWAGHFFALWFGLEPAVYGGIANAGQPIATVLLASLIACNCRITRTDFLTSMGVLAGISWLAYTTWAGRSAVGDIAPAATMAGVVLSMITALGLAGNTVFVTRLHRRGLETTEAMALRFIALLALAGALLPAGAWASPPPDLAVHVVILAVLGLALPLFCYQRGVEAMRDPQTVSLLLATLPVLQLLMQFADPRLSFSLSSLLGVLVTVGFSVLGIALRQRRPAAAAEPAPTHSAIRARPLARLTSQA